MSKDDFTEEELKELFDPPKKKVKKVSYEEASTLELLKTLIKRYEIELIILLGAIGWILAVIDYLRS